MPNPTNLLTEFQWSALLRGIEQDKCIFCVGPEFFTPTDSKRSQSQRLGDFLTQHAEDQGIRVREEGWYHLQSEGSDGGAYEVVCSFYASEAAHARVDLQTLAQIKAHLFLCLTPDHHLADAFRRQGFSVDFDAYVRNEPDRTTETPTKEKPLVYNLLGDVDQRHSLVLTYDDFFNYIESTFRGNSMSNLLKDNILSADFFVFLGMPEDDWRMHLFLHILKQHRKNRKNKYATMPGADEDLRASWREQYDIKLINDDTQDFLQELFRRCKGRELIRVKGSSSQQEQQVVDQLEDLIAARKISNALDLLRAQLKGSGSEGKDLMIQFLMLKNQYTMHQDKMALRIEPEADLQREANRITHALIHLVAEFAELEPKLSAP